VNAQAVLRASHEVRSPLTVALLALDRLVARGELRAEAAHGLRLQLDRIRLGVEDLAAAASGTAGEVRLDVVRVAPLLAQVALAWRSVGDVRAEPCYATVLGDPARLAQALGNLVANALEHGAPPVVMRARRAGARVRLEVHDNGPGLPASPRALTRNARGLRGHGLAIADSIAERHEGRLVADGAMLALELPLRDR
jgi:signal transduction histidine kinase